MFKKEFEGKLNELDIYDEFINNLNVQGRNTVSHVKMLNNCKNWNDFISFAFVAGETSEGFNFWDEISKL